MKKSSQFVLEWEKALGWHDNPLQDKIFEPVEQFIVGYEKERQKINLFVIENYKYGLLLGEEGTGKTTLLRWIRSQLIQYKQRFCVLYINAKNLLQGEFLKSLVFPFLNPFEQYFTRPWGKLHIGNVTEFIQPKLASKSMILLLDEAQCLSKPDMLILKHLFDSTMNFQLIVAGLPEEMKKSSISTFAHDELSLVLHGLKIDEIMEMLTLRIEALGGHSIEPFDHEMLSHIARDHQNNPKRVLLLCNDLAIKLSLKHAFTKRKEQQQIHQGSKFFMVENVAEEEKDDAEESESKITDIFLPGLLDEPKKKAAPVPQAVEMTDDIIQKAAAEIKDGAKQIPKKKVLFGKRKQE